MPLDDTATPGSDILVRDGELAIRRMRDIDSDYGLIVAWRNLPHVREWWDPDDPPMTMADCVAQYRETVDGSTSTTSCIIVFAGEDVGFVQFYPWADDAELMAGLGVAVADGSWGLDILIGEEHLINSGLGSRTVALVCDFLEAAMGARSVALATETTNARAIRAYEKAGMHRVGEFLDIDTRGGERVRSVFMQRDAVER